MLVCRNQAFVPAPVETVWGLIGDPKRHPQWWPQVIEVQGTQFGPGCSYCQVSREASGTTETVFLIERVEEFKELVVRCAENGLYMRWLLTEAQDGTFVDAEFGVDGEQDPELDLRGSQDTLRRWLQTSFDGLADATAGEVG